MTQIALGTTLGSATGTGATFKDYRLDGDVALFIEQNAVDIPGQLMFKRTDPKPVKGYPGASRGEIRLSRFYTDAAGQRWPATVTVTTSIPDFRTPAQKAAFVLEALIAATSSVSQACLANREVPQS